MSRDGGDYWEAEKEIDRQLQQNTQARARVACCKATTMSIARWLVSRPAHGNALWRQLPLARRWQQTQV